MHTPPGHKRLSPPQRCPSCGGMIVFAPCLSCRSKGIAQPEPQRKLKGGPAAARDRARSEARHRREAMELMLNEGHSPAAVAAVFGGGPA